MDEKMALAWLDGEDRDRPVRAGGLAWACRQRAREVARGLGGATTTGSGGAEWQHTTGGGVGVTVTSGRRPDNTPPSRPLSSWPTVAAIIDYTTRCELDRVPPRGPLGALSRRFAVDARLFAYRNPPDNRRKSLPRKAIPPNPAKEKVPQLSDYPNVPPLDGTSRGAMTYTPLPTPDTPLDHRRGKPEYLIHSPHPAPEPSRAPSPVPKFVTSSFMTWSPEAAESLESSPAFVELPAEPFRVYEPAVFDPSKRPAGSDLKGHLSTDDLRAWLHLTPIGHKTAARCLGLKDEAHLRQWMRSKPGYLPAKLSQALSTCMKKTPAELADDYACLNGGVDIEFEATAVKPGHEGILDWDCSGLSPLDLEYVRFWTPSQCRLYELIDQDNDKEALRLMGWGWQVDTPVGAYVRHHPTALACFSASRVNFDRNRASATKALAAMVREYDHGRARVRPAKKIPPIKDVIQALNELAVDAKANRAAKLKYVQLRKKTNQRR